MARGDFLFMKEKVIIFGTGSTGERIYEEVKDLKEVLGFLDNDQLKWGGSILWSACVWKCKACF